MKPENNKSPKDETGIENYNDRIIQLYDEKSTNFWRSLWIVIGFSAFFFFIILLPFVMLQAQNYETDLQLNQTNNEILKTNRSINTYGEVVEEFEYLQNLTSNGAGELRNFIEKISKEYDRNIAVGNTTEQTEIQQQIETVHFDSGFPSCNFPEPKDNWISCNVSEYLRSQFNNFTGILDQSIPSKLKEVNDSSILSQIATMSSELNSTSQKFQNLFNQEININPYFWYQFSGKSRFYDKLYSRVNEFWNKYHPNIIGNLTVKSEKLDQIKIDYEDQKNVIKANKNEIADKLQKLESPLGPIPVGVNESVVVFPIAIASGFTIYCYFFSSIVQLRKELYTSYKDVDPSNADSIKKKISIIAPLWIESTHSSFEKILKLSILVTPLALFIISWILISDSWSNILYDDMRSTFPYNRELYKQFYLGLYIFSLIFFAYGLFRISYLIYYDKKELLTGK